MELHSTAADAGDRLAEIERINSIPGLTWKAAAGRFEGTAPGSSAPLLGAVRMGAEEKQALIQQGRLRIAPQSEYDYWLDVPDSFDSETHWPMCAKVIGDIRDQSNCGCCWAFSTAEAASDRMCINTNGKTLLPLSSEQLCFCSNPDGCNGGDPLAAWQFIAETGLVTGGQQPFKAPTGGGTPQKPVVAEPLCSAFTLPHCHHHGPVGDDPYPAENAPGCPSQKSPACPTTCDAGAAAPHNEWASDHYTFSGGAPVQHPNNATAIQMEIMQRGPVTAAFSVYSDFENYASGVYTHTGGKMAGGHAVKIVGWGTDGGVDYWKIANSWNPYWGEKGCTCPAPSFVAALRIR